MSSVLISIINLCEKVAFTNLGYRANVQPFIENFVIKTKHKKRASTLSKALLAAGLLGIVVYGNAAKAAPCPGGSKCFYNQKIDLPDETFIFDLETDDFLTPAASLGYMNPGTVTPNPNAPLPPPSRDPGVLLKSEKYFFKGYKIQDILNGKRYENGVHTGNIKYRGETFPAPPLTSGPMLRM